MNIKDIYRLSRLKTNLELLLVNPSALNNWLAARQTDIDNLPDGWRKNEAQRLLTYIQSKVSKNPDNII